MLKKTKIALGIVVGLMFVAFAPVLLFGVSNLGAGLLSLALERQPTMQEMIGAYRFHGLGKPSIMVLKDNGTFQERVADHNGTFREIQGRWDYHYQENYAQLTFRPFADPAEDASSKSDFSSPCFRARWGTTRIVVNDDLGDEFRKVDE